MDPIREIARACVVIDDGPEAAAFAPEGEGGLQLGSKLRADGTVIWFFVIDSPLPRSWQRRLKVKDVLGIPVWTIDGGQSVHFAIQTSPAVQKYAVTYMQDSNRISLSMTEAEFYAVREDGLEVTGLTLTHLNRDHRFPISGRVGKEFALGLETRIRELGWK